MGVRTCVAGELGPCQWQAGPHAETCDGLDNDCDNQVDEDGASCAANYSCEQRACVPTPTAVWTPLTSITTQALKGLWGSSASNIWAVGAGGTMLRYNGVQWSSALSGTTLDLEDVWGTGPTDVWAVGGGFNTPGVILHYNGSGWTQIMTPTVGTANAVWGTSPTNVYVAGGDGGTSGYILHYNGSTWTFVGAPLTSRAVEVSGLTANDIWAVDLYAAHHFNGTTWSATTLTTTQLLWAVWLGAPNDGWAVGDDFRLYRFNGSAWQQVASPISGGNSVAAAVWGRAPNDVWAVGWATGNRAIIHFDGAGWQLAGPVVNAALLDVWGTSSTNVWAVGAHGTILHYTPN